MLFVGDDWAEAYHDVELMDATGRRLVKARLPEGVVGMARLHAMIGEQLGEDAEEAEVLVGIETDRGPADTTVFAAGAGPGSGIARKDSVDRAAASLLADAAEAAGVRRFLIISAMGVDHEPPEGTDPVYAAYLRAKGAADADVRSRAELDWTILRPGHLINEPGTGLMTLAEHTGRGQAPRDDVAAVLTALLAEPGTAGRTLELIGGDTPIEEAVKAVAS